MCAPQLTTSEEIWRTAGAVWWYRAALELRRTRKNVARIPLRGNSGSCNTRASGAASEKWRWAEQPKEIPEKNARKKTVRQSGERGVSPAPLLPLTRVEGTVQLPQDNLVPAKEKGGSEKEVMNAPITAEEIRRTLISSKSGKAPGPDGIPVEVYKALEDLVIPVLTELFGGILEFGNDIPLSWNEAVISLILKPGKNPAKCA
ncbi:hypothetical protein NDU88_005702 [Pleurodeles waltl]|uniref:Reverse transcriptase n=1 Tax=Pleurodeles waltl TaxID=8319 RepID=A0AAV7MYB9_PLEWA|nr:hypothetical protein NDU88_005702 [Pleurodeles waltl]